MPSLNSRAARSRSYRPIKNNRHASGTGTGIRCADDAPSSPDALRFGTDVEVDAMTSYVDRLAATIVANAIAAAKTVEMDATLGDLTLLGSSLRSTIIRVGQAIPDIIAKALGQDDRLIVLREYQLPLTRPATEIVDNNRSATPVELAHDRYPIGSYRADLVVIDEDTRHATIIECRRGSVALSSPKCGATVRLLRIAGLTARRALEADNYRISTVSCGVIDRYGNGGYSETMTVGPDKLDAFFGVPIVRYLDGLDGRIREKLMGALMPALSGIVGIPAARNGEKDGRWGEKQAVPVEWRDPSEEVHAGLRADNAVPLPLDLTRLVGPAELRRIAGVPRCNRPLSGARQRLF
ncbi:hypothetical protein VQ042_14095 [Aurantimonas sp. A2-1-M11]|uniref:hypothetical protein n=1 Tax=Aurantimonas sp. A2-1-M11 TaxID=3113712 RepID=UPI002F91EE1F